MSFTSFLKAIGHDFKKGLDFLLYNPYMQAAEGVAFTVALPGLGPVFNATKAAVILAEQKAAALNKQSGTGVQKLADVLQLMEPVIAQALKDAGKDGSTAGVTAYIESVVQVLNLAPAPAPVP
jgi:hypothetical protein